MHDYTPKAVKLFLVDPGDPSRRTQVLVLLAHIVRLVPRYYMESGGKQMVTAVAVDDSKVLEGGLKRSFLVFDDIGGQFDSYAASERAQGILEQMWSESA